jgi:hypothetical protein
MEGNEMRFNWQDAVPYWNIVVESLGAGEREVPTFDRDPEDLVDLFIAIFEAHGGASGVAEHLCREVNAAARPGVALSSEPPWRPSSIPRAQGVYLQHTIDEDRWGLWVLAAVPPLIWETVGTPTA